MRFYQMLPEIYRYQDERRGNPLKAYLSVLEETYQSLEDGLNQLFENCFIETCEPWVIPYIGELVGFKLPAENLEGLARMRPLVANALANRRRKGSHASLEKLLSQVTGWGICVKEGTDGPIITQHMAAPSEKKQGTVSLHSSEVAWLGSPFENSSRTVDIRSSDSEKDNSGSGSPFSLNINIWRLQSFQISGVRPMRLDVMDRCFSFSPIGMDIPLYKMPIPWEDPDWPNDIGTVPGPLLTNPLISASEWYRTQLAKGKAFDKETLERRQHFKIFVDGKMVPNEEIIYEDLSKPITIPAESRPYRTADGKQRRFKNRIAVDPQLGRMTFTEPILTDQISLQYAYGAVANLGSGPYDRRTTLCPLPEVGAFVSHQEPKKRSKRKHYKTLEAAIQGFTAKAFRGPIRIMDSGTYAFPPDVQTLNGEEKLTIEAANGKRPCLTEVFRIKAGGSGSGLVLNGLLIDGELHLESEDDGYFEVTLSHTTLIPKPNRNSIHIGAASGTFGFEISARHSILGSASADTGVLILKISDCIIDGHIGNKPGEPPSKAFLMGDFLRTTVLGSTSLRKLNKAIDCLFTGPVKVRQRESGLVRYSYFPKDSITPPTYRCIQEWQEGRHIQPGFSSTTYGDPAYARLEHDNPVELLTGSENGSEVGVWQPLTQMRKMSNLQAVMDEYLPFGLYPALQFIT